MGHMVFFWGWNPVSALYSSPNYSRGVHDLVPSASVSISCFQSHIYKHNMASVMVLGFAACLWDGSQIGQVTAFNCAPFFFLHCFLTGRIRGVNFWRLLFQSTHLGTCLSTGEDHFSFHLPTVGHFGLVHVGLLRRGRLSFPRSLEQSWGTSAHQPLQLPISIRSPDPMDFCLLHPHS